MVDEPIADVAARVLRRWDQGYVVDAHDAVTLAREVVRQAEALDEMRRLAHGYQTTAHRKEDEVTRLTELVSEAEKLLPMSVQADSRGIDDPIWDWIRACAEWREKVRGQGPEVQ